MLESDFLMRYVMRFMEQFTAILLAIIFDKKSENYDTALEKINEAYKELLHLNPDEIKCLPTNEIIENNTRNNILDMDNIEVIANLLFQEADILEMINGSSLLSVDYYQKSIELFIMLFNTKNDKKFCKNIEEVIPKLEKYKIKNETEYMLYEYYLKMEMYGKSEDALYHLLENGFPGIENKIKTFYGKLLEKEDDVL
ncbi:MAG: sodium bicarbonate transporter family protein, partial [Treponema sp.]|nr:sodium bicarbonate transporter family protein [Treponema sp.]